MLAELCAPPIADSKKWSVGCFGGGTLVQLIDSLADNKEMDPFLEALGYASAAIRKEVCAEFIED